MKKRYWAFVLYPESAPQDWKDKLQLTGLPMAISPLHNFDVDPTGEVKKEHYHIILCYSGPTTFNAVKTLTVDTLNATIPQPLESIKGYYRYLTHKDNPDKYQYNDEDIIHLNGFDLFEFINVSGLDRTKLKVEVIKDIKKNNILEYSQLIDFYINEKDMTKLELAASHTIFFNRYLSSLRYCKETEDNNNVDDEFTDDFSSDIEIFEEVI